MKNRPRLRNLNDTRKDRIVRVARNRQSFEKYTTSQKKDQNISIEQQEEQHQFIIDNDRIGSQEKQRRMILSPSDRSKTNNEIVSGASNQNTDNLMLKAWTTQ